VTERRLAAIMFTDIVGSTALMAESEQAALAAKERHRAIAQSQVDRYHGELIEAAGDETLSIFTSALDAVSCALAIQAEAESEADLRLHIGIHSGDVLYEGSEIHGDGVNIAARICSLSAGGGLCVSGEVYQSVRNQANIKATPLGEHELKNVGRPVAAFALTGTAGPPSPISAAPRRRRLRTVATATASAIVLLALGIWLSWPRPMGLVIDLAGVSGPPLDPPLPDRPSIVVLPFTNMSGDPDQEYFSDGITDDLIVDLSGVPGLFVIPRNSAFAYQGRGDLQDVGRELGVRYVLEGNVRRAADQVRITAQLHDTTSGFNVWSERYDRDLHDVFALQSEISEEILTQLQVAIREAELERIRRKPTDERTAYDVYLKGRSLFLGGTRQGNEEARRLFERAIELSQIALELNPYLSVAYQSLVVANLHLRRPLEALEAAKKAVELDPSDDNAHVWLGSALLSNGKLVDALQSYRQALRLNPRHPSLTAHVSASLNFRAGRIDEAVELWERVRAANPDFLAPRVALALHYSRIGRRDEARAVVLEILSVNPDFDGDYAAFLSGRELSDEDLALLREAGLP
jgi:adenylate cyclase